MGQSRDGGETWEAFGGSLSPAWRFWSLAYRRGYVYALASEGHSDSGAVFAAPAQAAHPAWQKTSPSAPYRLGILHLAATAHHLLVGGHRDLSVLALSERE